jgi:hypothetical protein
MSWPTRPSRQKKRRHRSPWVEPLPRSGADRSRPQESPQRSRHGRHRVDGCVASQPRIHPNSLPGRCPPGNSEDTRSGKESSGGCEPLITQLPQRGCRPPVRARCATHHLPTLGVPCSRPCCGRHAPQTETRRLSVVATQQRFAHDASTPRFIDRPLPPTRARMATHHSWVERGAHAPNPKSFVSRTRCTHRAFHAPSPLGGVFGH